MRTLLVRSLARSRSHLKPFSFRKLALCLSLVWCGWQRLDGLQRRPKHSNSCCPAWRAHATDNAIVEATERSFLEYMDHEGWKDMERQSYLPNRREYLTESAEEHRLIFEAVASGNGQEASELVHRPNQIKAS